MPQCDSPPRARVRASSRPRASIATSPLARSPPAPRRRGPACLARRSSVHLSPGRPARALTPPRFLPARRRQAGPPPRPRGASRVGDHRAHPEVPGREPAAIRILENERRQTAESCDQARLQQNSCTRRHRGRAASQGSSEGRRASRGGAGEGESAMTRGRKPWSRMEKEEPFVTVTRCHGRIDVGFLSRPAAPPFVPLPSPHGVQPHGSRVGEHRSALVQVGVPDEGAELPDVVLVLEPQPRRLDVDGVLQPRE